MRHTLGVLKAVSINAKNAPLKIGEQVMLVDSHGGSEYHKVVLATDAIIVLSNKGGSSIVPKLLSVLAPFLK